MKAKDCANRIAQSNNPRVEIETVLGVLVKEVMDATLAPNKTEIALVSVVREQFTKWRAIVVRVKTLMPELDIADSGFTALLGELHSEMLLQGVENKVFLAYDLNAQDLKAIARAKSYRQEREDYLTKNGRNVCSF